jgi:ankyrin repeat protein
MPERKVDPRFYAFRDAVRSDLRTAAEMLPSDPGILRLRNSIGETAMHFLAVENCPEEVTWLIEQGAELENQNQFQQTPLMEVAALGLLDMCKLLISRGANFRYMSPRGESVFSAAASTDQVEIIEYLIGLLSPMEDINPFFDDVDAEITLKHSSKAAALLAQRGLTKRWP